VDSDVEASPTITCAGNEGTGHVHAKPTLEMGAHGYFPGKDVDLESEASPTVLAQGFGSHKSSVNNAPLPPGAEEEDPPPYVFDTRGQYNAREIDVENETAPAIVNSGGAASIHHQIAGPPPPVVEGEERGSSLEGTAIGREWEKMKRKGTKKSDKYLSLMRPHPDEPSPTITACSGGRGVAGVTHPIEKRKFYISELKRICGFPDDFVLTGTYAQQWERLGNSVPPVMMKQISGHVRTLLDQINEG